MSFFVRLMNYKWCLLGCLVAVGCVRQQVPKRDGVSTDTHADRAPRVKPLAHRQSNEVLDQATFAGGCFWCMEAPFDALPGVEETVSGYTGGSVKDPTYKDISSGRTGHTEAVRVFYDPRKISYQALLEVFWRNIDPLVSNQQFCDIGSQYRTGIYAHNDYQLRLAKASKMKLVATKRFRQPIVTQVRMAGPFYRAEEAHQNYYRKHPVNYQRYRRGCGRDARLIDLWGDKRKHRPLQ